METENQLKVFENNEFGKVRTLTIDGEPWFVGKDVATALGFTDLTHAVLDHVDKEDRVNSKTQGQNDPEFGQRGTWLINESGLYSLILSSKLPKAKKFKRWVTSEVLPSIRKHGVYMTDDIIDKTLADPDFMIKLLMNLKEEKQGRQIAEAKVQEMKPKAEFHDAVVDSNGSISIGDFAKILRKNGIEIGRTRLFQWFREHKYLMSYGDWNSPTQRAVESGFFEMVEYPFTLNSGRKIITTTTRITGKGQSYFMKLLTK